jgi:hypothetical protein
VAYSGGPAPSASDNGFCASLAALTCSPRVAQASAASHRHTGGVAHDPDLPAARQWLALEQLGRLEQLLAAAKAHHPALMQHRVEHGIATQRRSGARARRYMSVPRRRLL